MDILNRPIPTSDVSINTGISAGKKLKIDEIIGFIVVFDGFKIPNTSAQTYAEMISYLQTKAIAAAKEERCYPFTILHDFMDETEDPEEKVDGFARVTKRVPKPKKFTCKFVNEGVEFHKNTLGFNEYSNLAIYAIAKNGIVGYRNAARDFLPFLANVFVDPMKIGKNTGDETTLPAKISLLDTKSMTTNFDIVEFPEENNIDSELNGIIDLVLSPYSTGKVIVEEKGTYKNLFDRTTIRTALASTSAWVARDSVTKAAVSITSVTADTTIKGFTFVTAVSPNPIEVQTVDPTALAALNIGSATAGGFESDGWCSLGE